MNKWLSVLMVTWMLGSGPYLLARCIECRVPEPSAMLLLATGVGVIGLWKVRRSKNAE